MNYDDWLEQPYQEAAERDHAIEQEVERLLEDEYDIKKFDVFVDAIANDCMHMAKTEIEQALATGDKHRLGELIFDAVAEQLDHWAESEAADRYNNGLIGDDRDDL
jgi:hypothetical protein